MPAIGFNIGIYFCFANFFKNLKISMSFFSLTYFEAILIEGNVFIFIFIDFGLRTKILQCNLIFLK